MASKFLYLKAGQRVLWNGLTEWVVSNLTATEKDAYYIRRADGIGANHEVPRAELTHPGDYAYKMGDTVEYAGETWEVLYPAPKPRTFHLVLADGGRTASNVPAEKLFPLSEYVKPTKTNVKAGLFDELLG